MQGINKGAFTARQEPFGEKAKKETVVFSRCAKSYLMAHRRASLGASMRAGVWPVRNEDFLNNLNCL